MCSAQLDLHDNFSDILDPGAPSVLGTFCPAIMPSIRRQVRQLKWKLTHDVENFLELKRKSAKTLVMEVRFVNFHQNLEIWRPKSIIFDTYHILSPAESKDHLTKAKDLGRCLRVWLLISDRVEYLPILGTFPTGQGLVLISHKKVSVCLKYIPHFSSTECLQLKANPGIPPAFSQCVTDMGKSVTYATRFSQII